MNTKSLRWVLGGWCLASALAMAEPVASSAPDALDKATQHLIDALQQTRDQLRQDPYYQGDAQRAAGMAHMARMLIRTLEEDVIQDPDYPYFRVLDFRIREGGDNPDQRYLTTPIKGGERYRIWGKKNGERRLEFQLYAGLPWLGSGRLVSAVAEENIRYGDDGSFEVFLGPEDFKPGAAANVMLSSADATMLMVRQIYSDWQNEQPGEVHIDRIGYEGRVRPVESAADLATRFDRAAENFKAITLLWPAFVHQRYDDARPANTLVAPLDTAGAGGVRGRLMSYGLFDIADDEALILTSWPSDAQYQGVQLTDLWFASLEYANRQTSLSADQLQKSADGGYRYVISARDPGVQNWLDSAGFQRGVILMRWDGLQGKTIPEQHWPQLKKVKLSELKKHLPADTPAYTPTQRERELQLRRRHVQQRFGV